MGNLRKLRRSIARHPLHVWRATQKAQQDEITRKQSERIAKAVDKEVLEEMVQAIRIFQTEKNEAQPKQEETSTPSNSGGTGNDVSRDQSGQVDSMAWHG